MARYTIQRRDPGTYRWYNAMDSFEDEDAAREAFDDFVWGGDNPGVEFKLFAFRKTDLFNCGVAREMLEQATGVANVV